MREIDFSLTQIAKRTRRKVSIDASLHGVKLKDEPEDFTEDSVPLTENEEKGIEKLYQEAFKRKALKRG